VSWILHNGRLTCSASLLAIEIIEVLINKDADCHQYQFPVGHSLRVVPSEHEEYMGEGEEDEGGEGDEVGGDMGGEVGDEFVSEGRPDIFVGNAVVSSAVLEEFEILLGWIVTVLHSGLTYFIIFQDYNS
jgi:hypothetical protein